MDIGELIKQKRLEKHLTVRELASETDLSVGTISQIENGKVAPNVISLKNIAKALHTSVTYFLRDDEDCVSLVRKEDRRVLIRNTSQQGSVIEEFITVGKNCQMNPGVITTNPGDDSGDFVSHFGEEFVLVLQGSITYMLEGINTYELNEGDTLYYDTSTPHRWKNNKDTPCVFLIVATPPYI